MSDSMQIGMASRERPRHPEPSPAHRARASGEEGALGPVIHDNQRGHTARTPRWDRSRRAARLAP
jgi:hypothetical protein